jgi:hypothetical protein
LADAYGAVLERWQRRPRADTDLDRIVNLLAALADGFALRQVVDPEGPNEDEFARTAVHLLDVVTVPAGSTEAH